MQRDAPHAQQLEAGQRNRETDTGGMARFTVVPLPCARFVAIRVPGRGVDTSHGVQSRFFLRPVDHVEKCRTLLYKPSEDCPYSAPGKMFAPSRGSITGVASRFDWHVHCMSETSNKESEQGGQP